MNAKQLFEYALAALNALNPTERRPYVLTAAERVEVLTLALTEAQIAMARYNREEQAVRDAQKMFPGGEA